MTEELLNKLLMTAAPSGYEGAVQVVFREHIALPGVIKRWRCGITIT